MRPDITVQILHFEIRSHAEARMHKISNKTQGMQNLVHSKQTMYLTYGNSLSKALDLQMPLNRRSTKCGQNTDYNSPFNICNLQMLCYRGPLFKIIFFASLFVKMWKEKRKFKMKWSMMIYYDLLCLIEPFQTWWFSKCGIDTKQIVCMITAEPLGHSTV